MSVSLQSNNLRTLLVAPLAHFDWEAAFSQEGKAQNSEQVEGVDGVTTRALVK